MHSRLILTLSILIAATSIPLAVGFALSASDKPTMSTHAVQEIDQATSQAALPKARLVEGVRTAPTLVAPIDHADTRVTKKPFGIEIHPETSPVENDRFDGYHVGVDFETTPEEADIDVPIYAICSGPLRFKQMASGYGGVAVQACEIDGEDVSVIYGHLRLSSIDARAGEMRGAGEMIGLLGTGESEETDGVRKHLHLGIRRGLTHDIRGYAKSTQEIDLWLDPLEYIVF